MLNLLRAVIPGGRKVCTDARNLDAEAGLPLYRPLSRGRPSAASHFLAKAFAMSRRCELTGVGPMIGNNVSHSNIKTKRRFLPALSPATLQSDALGQSYRLRVTNAALRTLDFRGGLDAFLLKAKDEELSQRCQKLKREVRKAQSEQAAA